MMAKSDSMWNVVAVISVIVIVICLVSLGMRMTGYATSSTGTVNVTVETLASINFTSRMINFSNGSVISPNPSATLDSNDSAPATWSGTYTTSNLTLVNNGNQNVTLDLKTAKSNSTLLGGTNPGYKFAIINSKAGSCGDPGVTMGNWNEVNTTSPGTRICGNFSATQAANTIAVYVQLTIPSDSKIGDLSDTFTATAGA